MTAPLLTTKLYIPPPRPNLVSRPRLIERLNAGLRGKLTLISAPVGFGKTTLLSEWVNRRIGEAANECAVAWLSLDAGDNDLARFLAYLVAALQTVEAGLGDSLPGALQAPGFAGANPPPPVEAVLTALINEVAAVPPGERPGRPYVIVLDDYHLITARPVHEAVTFLLEHLPDNLHLVIATRADPPLPLARLRARGQLTELRTADLRFTLDEAGAFLDRVMGLKLRDEDLAALEARTEGWIAGLQMASLAMQTPPSRRGGRDLSDFVRAFSGSHRFILDYLAAEVLDRQSPAVLEFLLKTSILKRLTAPLCDAVAGRSDSQTVLTRLERSNMFIVPLDDERRWYRYHHLFADLLRSRLAQVQPQQVNILHRRASEWYESAGLVEEAVAHAFAGDDFERAASLVEQNALQMITHGELPTVSKWIEALPDEQVRARPWLCVYRAWAQHWSGQREGVEGYLQDAEQALERVPSSSKEGPSQTEKQRIAGYIAAIRAHNALIEQDIPRVVEMARRAFDLLTEDDFLSYLPAVALGGAYWSQGHVVAAEQAFARARATARKGGYPALAVPAACYVGMQQAKQGNLRQALETYRQALEWATRPDGRLLPLAGFPLVEMGNLQREWNDLETADRRLRQGVELCVQLAQADVLVQGYVALARLQLAQGDFKSTGATLQRAERLVREVKVDPWSICWLDDCRLRLWLAEGDLAAATRWAQASGLRVDGALSYHHDLHHLNLARVLVAQGRQRPSGPHLSDALALLDRLLAAAEAAGWIHEAIKALVLQSLALQAGGDGEKALAALSQALTLAEPGGYVRLFVDEGAPLGGLLLKAIPLGLVTGYASQLLAALEGEVKPPLSSLIEPLTGREIEVLRLLTTSLSSSEIAQELFISVHTVRSHIKSIYGKLDVHRRGEAIRRARELGLL